MRGDKKGFNRALEKLALGYVMGASAYIFSGLPLITQFYAATTTACGYAFGSSMGWGGPFGAYIRGEYFTRPEHYERYEKWLPFTQKNVHYSLWMRGVFWALPCLPAAIIWGGWGPLIGIIIAFPVGLYIAVKYNTDNQFDEDHELYPWLHKSWQWAEAYRGGIAVAISLFLSYTVFRHLEPLWPMIKSLFV